MKLVALSGGVGERRIDVQSLFDDKRLISRTGIPEVFETSGTTSGLVKKISSALAKKDLAGAGLLMFVTQTPDDLLPANAVGLSSKLGLSDSVLAFDINQGCSGFVQALCLVAKLLPSYQKIIIATADRYRSKLAPDDRSTNAVFSDGASLSVWTEEGHDQILYEDHLTDGTKRDFLFHSSDPGQCLHMSGAELWTFTRTEVVKQISKALSWCEERNYSVKHLLIHQASKVVVEGIAANLPKQYNSLLRRNYGRYGNTVSSTIPILMQDIDFSFERGEVAVLAGFGVGLTSSVIVYGPEQN